MARGWHFSSIAAPVWACSLLKLKMRGDRVVARGTGRDEAVSLSVNKRARFGGRAACDCVGSKPGSFG
eukprot:scaffold6562_cov60-Phaeocystis_antarctica.AAC.1